MSDRYRLEVFHPGGHRCRIVQGTAPENYRDLGDWFTVYRMHRQRSTLWGHRDRVQRFTRDTLPEAFKTAMRKFK